MRRLRMSRPRSSVPRRCDPPGPRFGGLFCAFGWAIGRRPARIAARMLMATQATQIQNRTPSRLPGSLAGGPCWTVSGTAGAVGWSPPRARSTSGWGTVATGAPAVGLGANGRALWSLTGDPRVYHGEEEVDEEIDHQGRGGHHE